MFKYFLSIRAYDYFKKGEKMDKTITKTRTCEKCKGQVVLNKVKLFPKNKTNLLVCDKCFEELSHPKSETKVKPLPPPEYVKYVCSRCRYAFKTDAVKAGMTFNLLCPYCGKSDRLQEI